MKPITLVIALLLPGVIHFYTNARDMATMPGPGRIASRHTAAKSRV